MIISAYSFRPGNCPFAKRSHGIVEPFGQFRPQSRRLTDSEAKVIKLPWRDNQRLLPVVSGTPGGRSGPYRASNQRY